MKLSLSRDGRQPQSFMTAEQYRRFWEKIQRLVKPDLDKYDLARRRSEEAARHHLVD